MMKRLTKTGNSVALVLDKQLLEAAHLSADSEVEVSTDGDSIVITKRRGPSRAADFRAGVEKMHEQYSGIFSMLAK